MLRWSLALVVLSSACLTPSLAPCGELLCADGAICVEETVCASPEQLAACVDIAPEGACSTSQTTGHCVLGVCVGNVCGDGVVTGAEACDGTELTLSCAQFGFYAGQAACKPSCTIDTAGCVGSCGDMIVQTEFDEQCDSLPPVEGCLDFGQDYGQLTCNAFCAPAISKDCRRYGWEQQLPPSVIYSGAAANALGVIGLSATEIDVVWNGLSSTRVNPGWARVTANATVLAAVGPTSIGWFDGTWHELAFGLAANWITLSDDGYLFGRTDTACSVSRVDLATGTVVSLPVPPIPACNSGVAFAGNELYVPQLNDGVRVWNGSSWTVTTAAPTSFVTRAGPQRFAAVTSSSARIIDVSVEPPSVGPAQLGGLSGISGVAFDRDGNELRLTSLGLETDYSFELRARGALFPLDASSLAGQVGADATADGRLLTFGTGVLTMRPLSVATNLPIDTLVNDVHLADDGVILCGSTVFVSGLAGFAMRPYSGANGPCREVSGSALGAHYVVSLLNGLLGYNAGNNSYQQMVALPVTSVAGDFTHLWTANGNEMVGIPNGSVAGAFSELLPAGCAALKLAMSPKRTFVGVGHCNNKLAVFSRGASWTTLAASAVIDAGASSAFEIAVGEDEIVFVRLGSAVYRIDGSVFTPVGTGVRISAVSATDLFIDQGGETMLHVTGTASQELRLASGPFGASRTHLFSWDAIGRRVYGIARATAVPDGP